MPSSAAAIPAAPSTPAERAPQSGAVDGSGRPAPEPPPELLNSLDDVDEGDRGRGAFFAGFAVVALVAAAAVAVYAQREALAAAVPALSGPLESYAALVDRLRAALADAVSRFG